MVRGDAELAASEGPGFVEDDAVDLELRGLV